MVGIDADLLARGELQHVLLVVLVWGGRTTQLGTAGPQDHRLAVMNAITGAVGQAMGRSVTGQLGGQELVFGQLAVAVVLHGALAHLGGVGRGVGRRGRHVGVVARIHRDGRAMKRDAEGVVVVEGPVDEGSWRRDGDGFSPAKFC
jgi:hypothetical protein